MNHFPNQPVGAIKTGSHDRDMFSGNTSMSYYIQLQLS